MQHGRVITGSGYVPHDAFLWNEEIVAHLAEHGVIPEEFEDVVTCSHNQEVSKSTGLPIVFGYAAAERYRACVFEFLNDIQALPVTAYEVYE